jgi:hypothetical protein
MQLLKEFAGKGDFAISGGREIFNRVSPMLIIAVERQRCNSAR